MVCKLNTIQKLIILNTIKTLHCNNNSNNNYDSNIIIIVIICTIYITSSYLFLLALWFQPYRPHTALLSTVVPLKDLSCQRESEAKEIIRKRAWIGSNVATVTSSCQEGSIMSINVNFMIPTLESGRQWKSLPD